MLRLVLNLALAGLLGAASAGMAAEKRTTDEAAYYENLPVVLTASRLPQSAAEAPNAITVIDRDLIRASGARELPDILRLVPGMYVTYQSYARGYQAVVSNHGLAWELAGRMQVLVDGRAVYNPTLGEVSWISLPLAIDDIERVEVVRGPSAASHGANSFLGVINIITRHAAQDKGTSAELARGSNNINDRMFRHGGSIGDLDYRFTLGYRGDSGYAAVHDEKHVHLFTLRADYRLNERDSFEFQAGYNGGPRGTQASPQLQPDLVDHPRDYSVRNHFQQLRWLRVFEPGNELSVQAYHNYLGMRDASFTLPFPLPGGPQFFVDDSIRAHRYELEIQHQLSPAKDLRWVWGGSLRRDTAEAPSTLAARVSNSQARAFAHAEWRIAPKWLLNAGAMIERTQFTDTEISPRAAVSFQLAPDHTLRVGVSRAVRNPSLFEDKADRRYLFNTIIGPVLVQRFLQRTPPDPETTVSREVAYVGVFRNIGLDFDARLFSDRIRKLIGAVELPNPASFDGVTREFRNLNDVQQQGLELQGRLRAGRSTRVGFAAAFLRTQSTDVVEVPSQSAPRTSGSLFVTHDFTPDFSTGIFYFHQSPVKSLGFAEQQGAINRVDLRLAYRMKLGGTRAETALVVQDLFNARYTDFRHENQFRRSAYASLRLDF